MKIVAINSSMRKGGNTEQIVKHVEDRLREKAALTGCALQFEYISLADLNLSFCCGCRVCFDKGEAKCPHKDSLLELHAKIQSADGVIFASPVYAEDVNAVMKNFIDRMAFNNHRPSFAGKSALLMTTSAMRSSNHAVRTMKFVFGAWGFHIAGIGKFSMGALMDKTESAEKFCRDTQKLSDRLFVAITEKKPLKPTLLSLIIFKVQQKFYRFDSAYKDTYDRAYWEKQGWLDTKAAYYIPHRANPIKTLFAKILSVPIAKIFT